MAADTVSPSDAMVLRVPHPLVWLPAAAGLLLVTGVWFSAPSGNVRAAGEEDPAQGIASSEIPAPAKLHPVIIRPGPETPAVLAVLPGRQGAPAQVACATCHSTRPGQLATRSSADLDEFHQGLVYAHGNLSCLSCHNADNYDTLRRADGTPIAYPDAIQLCAQCHGTHYRDYTHGSHGGATGFWDLTAGPRTRNTCLDCHDAHAPAFPRVQPVFPPQDRGARQQRERTAEHQTPSHE